MDVLGRTIGSRVGKACTLLCLLASVSAAAASAAPAKKPLAEVSAQRLGKLVGLDPVGPFVALTGHATALEGGAFGPDGQLYFTDITAPAGAPKVLRVNVKTDKVTPVHTDATSAFSSIQFSPLDHLAYLTNLSDGSVDRMTPAGGKFETVFSGPVKGAKMTPDDLTFDQQGNMFVSDLKGTSWSPEGRVVEIPAGGGKPRVLVEGMASPNGISFTPDYSELWVSEFTGDREDHLTLSEDHTEVLASGVGMTGNSGPGGFDFNAVDSRGDVYQCVYGAGRVLVWSPTGRLLQTIVIPQNLPRPQRMVANLAIKPGTRDGYLLVGGSNGGYLFGFRALARGGSQSNGGIAE
jgi:lactonase